MKQPSLLKFLLCLLNNVSCSYTFFHQFRRFGKWQDKIDEYVSHRVCIYKNENAILIGFFFLCLILKHISLCRMKDKKLSAIKIFSSSTTTTTTTICMSATYTDDKFVHCNALTKFSATELNLSKKYRVENVSLIKETVTNFIN